MVVTQDAKFLISTLSEDIIVTELETGKQVHKLEGVRGFFFKKKEKTLKKTFILNRIRKW